MKLFYAAASPFVRKVMVLLLETGQFEDVEIVTVAGTPLDSSGMPTEHNPLGKIPALVRDNGAALYDSRVICRFLDDRSGGNLYPAAPQLWEVLTLEAMADGIMEAAILMVYEARCRPADKIVDDWVDAQWGKVARALDDIERRWLNHLGGKLDMAQVAIGCALAYLDFRHDTRDWRSDRPGLAAWEAEFSKRDSMISTAPTA